MFNRVRAFAGKNIKELLRDPLTLCFGIAFPIVLLVFMQILAGSIEGQQQGAMPTHFLIANFGPATAVFSLSFITLFCGMMLSRDRTSSFLVRLYATPIKAGEFIAGYTLPFIVISLVQSCACLLCSVIFGLELSINILLCMLALVPVSMLFVGFGLLFGALLSDKQVGGISGGLLVNVTTLLGGMWFDLSMMGKGIETVAYCLPFAHGIDLARKTMAGNSEGIWLNLLVVTIYALVLYVLAILVFKRKMKNN